MIELATSSGRRRLKLGPDYRVSRTAGLRAELDQLLGPALIASPQTGVAAVARWLAARRQLRQPGAVPAAEPVGQLVGLGGPQDPCG